jgi:hypothetical protein
MEEAIEELRPDLVFIDSVNKVYDFKKHGGDYLIDGSPEDNLLGFREVCNRFGTTVIFIGQVNQDGSNKGGTSLDHAVDIHFLFSKVQDQKKQFKVEIGVKQRYGSRDPWAIFEHNEDGVVEITRNRFYDEVWCKKSNESIRIDLDLENVHFDFAEKEIGAPNKKNEELNIVDTIALNEKPKKGFFRRWFSRLSGGHNPVNSNGVDLNTAIQMASQSAFMNSKEYKKLVLNNQLSVNNEEIQRRSISQAMYWLVPRFEKKLDEISQKIKKDW